MRLKNSVGWLAAILLILGMVHPWNGWAANATILHSFDFTTGDGGVPRDSLVADSTHIYGMANCGGGPQGDGSGGGVIFKSKRDGSDYTILHKFGGYEVNDGAYPWGSLVLSGSTLYGMTADGGIGDQNKGDNL